MTSPRLDLRVDDTIKLKTEYIVKIMNKNTSKVIAKHKSITLKDDIFIQFMAACNQAQKPNDALKAALQLIRQQGFNTNFQN